MTTGHHIPSATHAMRSPAARQMLSKVPEITIYFWIIKLLSTAMGEATSDYLALQLLGAYPAVIGGFVVLVAVLAVQVSVRRYIAWIYWATVVMVAVFGTMAADTLHVGFGIPYAVSTAFFAVALIVVFALWYKVEGTLSIHSIRTRRRELFYWATVMATFALGTAAGDMTATTLGWGYLASAVVFGVAFLIPGLAYWKFRLNGIAAFWIAYVLTRPFGASVADWMGVPHGLGGLGLGRGPVAIIFTIPIVALVAYLSVKRPDVAEQN